ncbi:MAG: hypothetical protein C4545_01550 [Anaerolineaceae bacterium]|jgi:hypothetical protein|nr:MAG: hypothetical protein C4545_01550 [Anaerolineaceae bacterium]
MNAVHWLRTRLEERELVYWLSILSYDKDDHSFGNRVYLFYLFLFFSVWLFAMLTFLAQGGAVILGAINANDPVCAATFLEISILGLWNLFALWQAMKRSPIVFSEQDATLICQMPVSHRQVVMRWFFLPWLKNAIPFWLLTIVIGFSVAETTMAGSLGTNSISGYIAYGLRAWITIIPVQLALFSLQWIFGIYRLQKDSAYRWLKWLVMIFAILFLFLFLSIASNHFFDPLAHLGLNLTLPIQAGFGKGSLTLSLGVNWFFAAIFLGILFWISDSISLARAAQETQAAEVLNQLSRFGFTSYANELRTQHRLGVSHVPSRLPKFVAGGWMLIWKDLIQSSRNWNLSSLFDWFTTFSITVSLPFIPDIGSRIFVMAFWSIRLGTMSVRRLRSDLSCWQIIRQLPISYSQFLFLELSPTFLLSIIISAVGLIFSALVIKSIELGFALLIPGIIAGVIGIAAFDIIRRARSNYLLNGSVPEISAGGYLLGSLTAIIPIILYIFFSGVSRLIFPFFVSLIFGYFAFKIAVQSYRNIDKI